jgi:hypothetical protein
MVNRPIQTRKIKRAGTRVETRPESEGVAALVLELTFWSEFGSVLGACLLCTWAKTLRASMMVARLKGRLLS